MIIKILGTGCTKCVRLERLCHETVTSLGVDATIEKIEDLETIMGFGVMSTPGLVVNDELILSGKVPKPVQLREILASRMNTVHSDQLETP